MQYRCEATSLAGFIQQLGNSYLGHGFWFWRDGRIPEGKDPEAVDRKMVEVYNVAPTAWERARRKREGEANAHYLRHGHYWVLLGTHRSVFEDQDQARVRDARKTPIRYRGYSVSHRQGHVHVRIELDTYRRLKAHFVDIATSRTKDKLVMEFYSLPFEPWAPVKDQFRCILRAVNRARKRAGFEKIPIYALPYRRPSVKVFEPIA